jgi:D-alanyl-D-alanine dipeptidase
VLLSDPRVAAVPVRDSGEPLTELDESFGSSRALVRVSVARRLALAPHVAGAAVDLTLVDSGGRELDFGTPVDATPEQSGGACYFDAPQAGRRARANRELLAQVLRGAGLVNYPTEWWHWSYGDRYWALMTGAATAVYGPVGRDQVAR